MARALTLVGMAGLLLGAAVAYADHGLPEPEDQPPFCHATALGDLAFCH